MKATIKQYEKFVKFITDTYIKKIYLNSSIIIYVSVDLIYSDFIVETELYVKLLKYNIVLTIDENRKGFSYGLNKLETSYNNLEELLNL